VAAARREVDRDDVVAALHRIAFLLEREQASEYRAKAYRSAGSVVGGQHESAADAPKRGGSRQDLPGIGAKTASVIETVVLGKVPRTLTELESNLGARLEAATPAGRTLRAAVRGDLHAHTDASDGGAPVQDMALAAVEIGHEYQAVTDHSPRLTVANGLSPARLRAQVGRIQAMNEVLAPFRLLTGIEVDILDDGGLDQEPGLLGLLDVVVA
jgi:putative hydrolase